MTGETDLDYARAIVMHMTGKPDDPTPMLMDIISQVRYAAERASHKGRTHSSILRDWVMELPLRYQGVAAVRGCDGQPKENPAKPIVRALRYAMMNPADPREVGMPSAFMSPRITDDEVTAFIKNWDQYPIHFVQHLMHACQVVGVKHPEIHARNVFMDIYLAMVHKLHLEPESDETMHDRLTEDRIARYGNAHGPHG